MVYMLERNGVKTGMELTTLIETANWLSHKMNKQLPGMVSRAGAFPAQLDTE